MAVYMVTIIAMGQLNAAPWGRLLAIPFSIAILTWPALLSADEILLEDGSLIIGDIENLVDGDLYVDTEHMDVIIIDWTAVVEIRSSQEFMIELHSGRRLHGGITRDEKGVTIERQNPLTVQPDNVAIIHQLDTTFLDRLSAYIDLGATLARGNNELTQATLSAGMGYEGDNYETNVTASTFINRQEGADDIRRNTLYWNYNHQLGNHWRGGAFAQFEEDEQQQLDLRSTFGGTLGKRLISNPYTRLDFNFGIAETTEDFVARPVNDNIIGLVGVVYRLRSPKEFDVDLSYQLLPYFDGADRYRSQLDARIAFEIKNKLDFVITLYHRYDSRPPVDVLKIDYGLTVGLGWSLD